MNEGARSLLPGALLLVLPWLMALWVLPLGCRRSDGVPPPREDQLTVFAATSLRDVFTTLGSEFETAHPGVEVVFNFAGTQTLRAGVENGAQVDVFASADQLHMDELRRSGRVQPPMVFAHNVPVLIVPREGTNQVNGLRDLPRAERIVLGAREVPIGRYSEQTLERARAEWGSDFRARVEARVVSRELNVRQVLAKVSLGEAQAGIVYRSDAQAAGAAVAVIPIPDALNVVADYPIAVVTGCKHPGLARAWLDFVLSPTGQRALADAGFSVVANGASP